MTRIAQSICALAIVGLLPSAAWAVGGRLPSGHNYDGRMLVVTGQPVSTGIIVCGVESELYQVVIVLKLGEPAIRTTLHVIPTGTILNPGDRFNLTGPLSCGDGTHVTVQITPLNMGDSEAVVSESVYTTSELSYHDRLLVVPTAGAGGSPTVNNGDVYEQRAILIDPSTEAQSHTRFRCIAI